MFEHALHHRNETRPPAQLVGKERVGLIQINPFARKFPEQFRRFCMEVEKSAQQVHPGRISQVVGQTKLS